MLADAYKHTWLGFFYIRFQFQHSTAMPAPSLLLITYTLPNRAFSVARVYCAMISLGVLHCSLPLLPFPSSFLLLRAGEYRSHIQKHKAATWTTTSTATSPNSISVSVFTWWWGKWWSPPCGWEMTIARRAAGLAMGTVFVAVGYAVLLKLDVGAPEAATVSAHATMMAHFQFMELTASCRALVFSPQSFF